MPEKVPFARFPYSGDKNRCCFVSRAAVLPKQVQSALFTFSSVCSVAGICPDELC